MKIGARIWIIIPEKKLNRTNFVEVRQKFSVIQGYYSSFKKAFMFSSDPTEKLNNL